MKIRQFDLDFHMVCWWPHGPCD